MWGAGGDLFFHLEGRCCYVDGVLPMYHSWPSESALTSKLGAWADLLKISRLKMRGFIRTYLFYFNI